MTDGIIQKAFRRYEQDVNYTFEQFKQELIANIKQEFPDTYPFAHVYNTVMIKQLLIGDNKDGM